MVQSFKSLFSCFRHDFSLSTESFNIFWTYANLFNYIRAERHVLFQRELAERETEDILDRALLKAHNSKLNGAIPAATYHRVAEKIESLKKLRFTEEYERLQDRETYEYMKYKVAAEVGGPEEMEAYKLYERTRINEVGHEKYSLFR